MTARDTAPTPGDAGARPTQAQRTVLEHLANGAQIIRGAYGESYQTLCLISADGEWIGRVTGGMRHRMTRDGWLSRLRLTDAGRLAIEDRADDAGTGRAE